MAGSDEGVVGNQKDRFLEKSNMSSYTHCSRAKKISRFPMLRIFSSAPSGHRAMREEVFRNITFALMQRKLHKYKCIRPEYRA